MSSSTSNSEQPGAPAPSAETRAGHPVVRLLVRAALFGLLALGVLELLLRFVLPARESPIPWQEPDQSLLLYDPSVPDGLFTSGRLAEQRSPWHINTLGWNAGIEYRPAAERDRPVVAVVGDSQIEGFYVAWPEHIASRLSALSDGRIEGQSYGGSAFQIATFARIARYLGQHHLDPEVLVFAINRGDFWYTLRGYGRPRAQLATWAFDPAAGTFTETPPAPYRTTTMRRLMRTSALVRYLVFNAGLNPLAGGDGPELGMAELKAFPEAEADFQPLIGPTTEHLLDEVAAALPHTFVLFAVEADRRAIHRGEVPAPIELSAPIAEVCRRRGCGHLDLTDAMVAAFRADGQLLNFPHNAHWNAHAHDVVARAIYAWLVEHDRLPTKR